MDNQLIEGSETIVSEIFKFKKSDFTEKDWQALINFYSMEENNNAELV